MTPIGTGLGEPSLPPGVVEKSSRRQQRKHWAVARCAAARGTHRRWTKASSPVAAGDASAVRLAPVFAGCGETPREATALATDCREAVSSGSRMPGLGRFEPARPRRTGRSRSAVAQGQHGGQLSHTLLTLMAALAAGLEGGLMALNRRRPSGGDWLLTLQNRQRAGKVAHPLTAERRSPLTRFREHPQSRRSPPEFAPTFARPQRLRHTLASHGCCSRGRPAGR
jgi:hypothetical protein